MNRHNIRIRNWAQYNKALTHRGSITFWFSKEAIAQWCYQGQQKPGGSILYSDLAIQVCLTLKEVYQLPYRQTQGLVNSLFEQLGITHLRSPHYTRLCRRARTIKIQLTQTIHRSSPICVLVDSTGIKIYGESEWYASKYGQQRRHQWRKLHLSIDHENQMILSAKMTPAYVHDATYFTSLVEQLPKETPVHTIIGDGSYSLPRCHLVAKHRSALLIAPPHRNSRKQSENRNYAQQSGLPVRDASIEFVRQYPSHEIGLKAWKHATDYHRRSLVETAMFRLKSVFGDTLRARHVDTQQQLLLVRCAALNQMTSLGMPQYSA